MPREGLLKNAFLPVWTRVPGTPFSLPGQMDPRERLHGMDTWAPRERLERVSAGMRSGVPVDTMMQAEGEQDLGRNVLTGAGAGLVGGGMLGRLVGGEASVQPLKDIATQGLIPAGTEAGLKENATGVMKQLAKLPTSMKALAAAGALGGAYYGANRWAERKPLRQHETYEAARSLHNEQLLNDINIMKGQDYLRDRSILQQHPSSLQDSSAAKESIPHVVTSSQG